MKRNAKRALGIVLALLMCLGMCTGIVLPAAAADVYQDVSAGDWFYENVKSLKEMKLMVGYHDGTFRPENNISLAESIVVAARLHAAENKAGALRQGDVWYEVYTDYAVNNGLVDKLPADVAAPATREEFAHLLAKALPLDNFVALNRVPEGAIPDVESDEAIYMLYRAGVLVGADDEGNFYPDRPITRAETAAIITRMADPSLRLKSGIFGIADVEVDASGAVKNDTTIDATEAKATVPAGASAAEGATKLELSVTPMAANEANVKLTYPEVMTTYDVHVEGIAADNTVPVIIELNTVLDKGLNISNISVHHVENGETVAMTPVASLAELDAHNEFYYDPATGKLTVAMASFSEIAVVATEGDPWDGTIDTSWYNTNDEEFTITTEEQLAGFAAIVGGMADGIAIDTFAGKTIKLGADLDLGSNTGKVWYPVGYKNSRGSYGRVDENGKDIVTGVAGVTSDVYSFEGTFDGQGHTVSNIYQNTWDMFGDYNNGYSGTPNYYKDGMGLFGFVYNGTVKNLTVDNFQSDGEFCTTGVVAAYAAGNSVFENITIINSNPRAYNVPNGGVVGYAYDEAEADTNEVSFTDIKVGSSNKITALWGSWDVACGGILGRMGDATKVNMTSCDVSAVIDVYNDVCGNYQYYQYRYCGMLIGTAGSDSDPEDQIKNVTFSDCHVRYGDWAEWYYCELVANSIASYTHDYQFSRLEKIASLSEIAEGNDWIKAGNFVYDNNGTPECYHIVNKDGVLTRHMHEDSGYETDIDEDNDGNVDLKEDKTLVHIPFKQLYTGYGWGSSPKAENTTVMEYVYTVTYLESDGSFLKEDYVSVEDAKAGYETLKSHPNNASDFEGWVNPASQPVSKIESGNKNDVVLYAAYTKKYTARWYDVDDNLWHSEEFVKGQKSLTSQIDTPPTNSEYLEFDCWDVRNDDGTYTHLSEYDLSKATSDISIVPLLKVKEGAGNIGLEAGPDNDGDNRPDYYTIEAVSGLSGEIEIPGYVNGVPVTVITDLSDDFINSNITSIEIKDGVQTISNNAFAMTTGLKDVTIPSSVTSIGKNAFAEFAGAWIGKTITITYDGTWEQYKEICADDWERGLATGTKVVCTDGIATLSKVEEYYYIYHNYEWTWTPNA